ncbi:GNAT family N-acetyltransferase [Hyunsoonleella pacifica]|uniref:GNAT family N-acetyltransferase n=1 Tax=Hyunsoonleella pacifica TaxID=1080224 RepID=A0A4Q9FT56_9FLAO|nr:GNAT family N-acetyltransferase [Hyunsoonleella pacifica]TBN19157.1 GNAT family N-acetyltransferase [Hyunsoonleella pacifica]GGD07471.1 hypothetical protein GCM10011368_06750 [Hyunsoonleella pacifica]
MITLTKAITHTHFKAIETLAYTIWHEHYIPITGKPQVEYMLNKFQSAKVIAEQTNDGFQYFILRYNEINAGYISIKKDDNTLFLSKIYILKPYRGKGFGKKAMQFIEEKAIVFGYKSITLTVNKNNTDSIKAYNRMGFKKLEAIVIDIGNGFVMDDFKMEKQIL